MATTGDESGGRSGVPDQRGEDADTPPGSENTRGAGPDGDGAGIGQVVGGVAGLLVAVIGGAAALVVLDGQQAFVVACIAAAAMPWALALIPQVRHWPRRAVALAAGFTAAMLTVAAVGSQASGRMRQPDPQPTSPSVEASSMTGKSAPPRIEATITEPVDDGVVRRVPVCLAVRGAARLPADLTLVVATKQAGDTRYYFEADVRWDGDRWSAEVSLSRDSPEDAGSTFTLVAVAMDKNLAQYLAATSPTAGDTWWSNPNLPPDAVDAERIDVIRSTDMSRCA